jgi:hypothetical protein
MSDVAYVAAAYVVIVGGLALYAFSLLRRLATARREHEHRPPDVEGR